MKANKIVLDTKDQVVDRIIKEIFTLFQISTVAEGESADVDSLFVANAMIPGAEKRPAVRTTLLVRKLDGEECRYFYRDSIKPDEKEAAGIHRIIKRNLYIIFLRNFSMQPAPWGILHGVRPTKIVHRFIDSGMSAEQTIARMMDDYAVSRERAERIVQIAFLQRPYLATSSERTVSIYVGIPFCLSRCLYCSFPSNELPPRKGIEDFLAAWEKDLQAVQEAVQHYRFEVQNIYVGGGTPTSLPDDLFARMLQKVRDAFYSHFAEEFTVEAGRPDSMTEAKIACMKDCGVTRVSVNPQSMQQRTLDRIGRKHTPEDIVRMFYALRKAGIRHINMDLIIGLPGEGEADIEDTMRQVAELNPDDITLHALALKRGSQLKMNLQDYELPDDATAQRMFDIAMRHVKELGMRPYYLYRQGYMRGQLENVGCCHQGAESMYNIQIMEEHQTVLGIGAAATSKIVNFREGRLKSAFHPKDLNTYMKHIDTYIAKRGQLLCEADGETKEES